jgi:predicted Zn-ribbon and HTH transcriptional regulator
MKHKVKEPVTPIERHETVRQQIISLLDGRRLSAREISGYIGIPEREVYDHLEHIQRSVHRGRYHLDVTHPLCRKCGFIFRKRERLHKPGRCPVCRGESIEEPLFSLTIS